ncbi:MAG: hypothetical protein MI702_13915, partial [Chlorobiales bacterium]|nr:hypothetical protein [Chlorobiales bacterium]
MKKGRPSYNEENVNFIKEVFGDRPIIVELQEEDMMFLFYEMIDCYLSGYYLASFMLSHAFIENSLLSYYQSK